MTLRERINELNGLIKVGCSHSSGFIFIGEIRPNTANVFKAMSSGYLDRCENRYRMLQNRLNDFQDFSTKEVNTFEEMFQARLRALFVESHDLREKLKKLRMNYDENYIDVKKCIADISKKEKQIEKLKTNHKKDRDSIERRIKILQDGLVRDVKDIKKHMIDFKGLDNCEVVEEYDSDDPAIKPCTILLIDAWESGKFWLPSEAAADFRLQVFIENTPA